MAIDHEGFGPLEVKEGVYYFPGIEQLNKPELEQLEAEIFLEYCLVMEKMNAVQREVDRRKVVYLDDYRWKVETNGNDAA